jgi:hypothetical protein
MLVSCTDLKNKQKCIPKKNPDKTIFFVGTKENKVL